MAAALTAMVGGTDNNQLNVLAEGTAGAAAVAAAMVTETTMARETATATAIIIMPVLKPAQCQQQ
jgi:hypothetical protein